MTKVIGRPGRVYIQVMDPERRVPSKCLTVYGLTVADAIRMIRDAASKRQVRKAG